MNGFKKVEENLEKWVLIISLIAMTLIIFVQVVLRWFGRSLVWAEELARYIMLYQVWIGAAYAVREDAHIRITAIIGKLKGAPRKRFDIVVLTIWLVFSLWLTAEGFVLVNKIADMNQVSSAMQIPMTIPYASVPVGGGLMTIRLIQKMVLTLKTGKNGDGAEGKLSAKEGAVA